MKLVPNSVSRVVARQVMKTKVHSPTILLVAGTTGMVASTVLACRATLKLDEILAEGQNDIQEVESVIDGTHVDAEAIQAKGYNADSAAHDVKVIRVQTALKVAKIYAPAVIVGVASIYCLTKSHSILRERNAQLTAAYVAVSEAYNKYRERVREEVGVDKERELYHGVVETEKTIEDRNGPKKVAHKSAGTHSPYARFFNESNLNWSKEPSYNYVFLRGQEKFANDKLRATGFLSLNDVYEALGMDKTAAGCIAGWVYDKNGDNPDGDSYIQFNIWDEKDPDRVHQFLIGAVGEILVDFNVDDVPIHKQLRRKRLA